LSADAASIVEEGFGAIRLVQIFGREPYEQARFRRAARDLYAASIARARLRAVFGPVVGLATLGALVIVIWMGGRQVLAGTVAAGDLVAFVAYAAMIGTAGASLSELYGQWAASLGATRRVFGWLDTEPVVDDGHAAADLNRAAGELVFKAVSFSYRLGRPVMRGIEFRVEPGQTLALVGPTGAGKSTVMHLIARFYDPDEGSITLDGVDLRDMTLKGLRHWIGVVPQETVLFNATVIQNLRYGRLDASDEAVRSAARSAHADEFIDDLPQGYETLVGERGIRLSAGQRQRIAIARALLKDPRVLLLDEATSSLDSASERLIQDALETLLAGRTTVVVAHRLSTVQRADAIAVLDHGEIVAYGPHEQLLGEGGLYRRLYDLQFRPRQPAADR
jgi:subfamily B ATP-binding cassette protein MsbA